MIKKLRTFDPEKLPTEEWICPECKSINNNWRPNFTYMSGKSNEMYVKGVCPECDRRNKEIEERYKRQLEKQEQEEESKRLIKFAQVPESIKNIKLESLIIPNDEGYKHYYSAMKRIENAKEKGFWIYVHGDNNVGKTHLIGATINRLIGKKIPCLYLNECQFFNRIKRSWDKNEAETETKLLNMFDRAEIIFFDEFLFYKYTDSKNEWKYDRLYSIIEYLCETNKTIVFASNVSAENKNGVRYHDIEERAGKRVVARLRRNKLYIVELKNKPFV